MLVKLRKIVINHSSNDSNNSCKLNSSPRCGGHGRDRPRAHQRLKLCGIFWVLAMMIEGKFRDEGLMKILHPSFKCAPDPQLLSMSILRALRKSGSPCWGPHNKHHGIRMHILVPLFVENFYLDTGRELFPGGLKVVRRKVLTNRSWSL